MSKLLFTLLFCFLGLCSATEDSSSSSSSSSSDENDPTIEPENSFCKHLGQKIILHNEDGLFLSYRYRNGACSALDFIDYFPPQPDNATPHTVQLFLTENCSGDFYEIECNDSVSGTCCKDLDNGLIKVSDFSHECIRCLHSVPSYDVFDLDTQEVFNGIVQWPLSHNKLQTLEGIEFYLSLNLEMPECCNAEQYLYYMPCVDLCS